MLKEGSPLKWTLVLQSAGQEEKEPKRNSKEIANIHSILSVLQMRKIIFQWIAVFEFVAEEDNKGEGMCETGGATVDKKRGTKVAPRQREGH